MKEWDNIIEQEVRAILLKEESGDKKDEDLGPSPLEQLDAALKDLQGQDEIFDAIFAPYLVMRDLFKLAVTGLKLILNDVVFMVKKTLAIRPSSWKAATEGHEKRRAKLMKDWDASMKATGADSATADLISFLAMPAPFIAGAVWDQGIKTTASINHALIDSGIRLPLMSLLPGGTPPEELDMDRDELEWKKRGELSTKDAVKVALMKLFFAHHEIEGNILSEAEDETKPKEKTEDAAPAKVKVTSTGIKKYLEDTGIWDKSQQDLKDLMDAKKKAVENFWESENPSAKVQQASRLLKAKTPEELVKIAKTIDDDEMSKAVNKYIKSFNEAAEKIANDKKFQKTYKETQKKDGGQGQTDIDKESVKKEAIQQVFAKTHPEFKKAMSESLAEYSRWVIESVESIYKIPKKALDNPIVKKGVDEKNDILENLINNISL